jgi:hypothetical protein
MDIPVGVLPATQPAPGRAEAALEQQEDRLGHIHILGTLARRTSGPWSPEPGVSNRKGILAAAGIPAVSHRYMLVYWILESAHGQVAADNLPRHSDEGG